MQDKTGLAGATHQLAEAIESQARRPWLIVAFLAVVFAGTSITAYFLYQQSIAAEAQRQQLQDLATQNMELLATINAQQSAIIAAQKKQAEAERTITREIIREEVPGLVPTQTKTVTVRATVTETVVCAPNLGCSSPPEAPNPLRGATSLVGGLAGFTYVVIRRTLRRV